MCAFSVTSVISNSSVTLWTAAYQAPPSMGFSRQEYWSVWPFPPPGHLPDPGVTPTSPALWVDSLPLSHQGLPPRLLFQIIFDYMLWQDNEDSCLCCTMSPCWSPILHTVVCIGQSQTPIPHFSLGTHKLFSMGSLGTHKSVYLLMFCKSVRVLFFFFRFCVCDMHAILSFSVWITEHDEWRSIHAAQLACHSPSWLGRIPVHIRTASLSTHLSMDT